MIVCTRSQIAAKYQDESLARLSMRVGSWLLHRKRSVSTAESCTGGWIAKCLTDVAGSSAWFLEGLVTYSNKAKIDRLGVQPHILRRHGAVSEATVRAMALGVLKSSGAALSVAVSGIAGPGGASPGKPVGTVWLAWGELRGSKYHVISERRQFRGDRDLVRRKTVRRALLGLVR